MNGEGHDDTGRGHGHGWVIGVVVALVVYVLSPPPLALLFEKTGVEPPGPLMWIYYPLGVVYERVEPVKAFYNAYGQLIGVEM
jgi:uncharacterized RDD family membrane protein YckC